MLIVQENGAIRLTRGDTARLTVTILNQLSGEPYVIRDTDILTLTVKKSVKDMMFCFQKEVLGSCHIQIKPADTKLRSFGMYKYDVQLKTRNGDIYTVIPPTNFEIMPEVTY